MVTLVYADASYDKKSQKAGLAVVIMRHNHGEKPVHQHFKKLEEAQDSNMAELQAVLYGVEQLNEADENIIIMTDNKNVKQTIKRPNREEYKGARSEIGLKIRQILDNSPNRAYRIYHIKGHTGFKGIHYENQQWCDEKARNTLRKSRGHDRG